MTFKIFERTILFIILAIIGIIVATKSAECGEVNTKPLAPVAPIEAKALTTVYAGGLLAKCSCSGDTAYTGVAGIEYGNSWRIGYMITGHEMHYFYGKYIYDSGLYAKLGAVKRKSCTSTVGAVGLEWNNMFIEVNTAEQVIGGVIW